MSNSSEVDERTLREIYFPAFETAVKKSQPYTVMCSYNRINGTYASEDPWLLTEVLRNEWGFEGYVVSDWGAVNDRVLALKAGLELEMPSSGGVTDREIIQAVQDGSLEESVLDRAVERILRISFLYLDNRKGQPFTLEADHDFARRLAEQSMVLLKNEEMLPLEEEEKVAFIGGFAKTPRFQGGGSSHINSFRVSSALEVVSHMAKASENVTYAEGFSVEQDVYDEALAAEAIEAARRADKAVVFAELPESFESESYDRSHMRLPDCQNRLIAEIIKVQPNTVVVLHNGSPVEMPWLSDVKGLMEAYLGGQAVGEAEVNLLYGKVNPSGKLAETIPCRLADNPSYLTFGDSEKTVYSEGVFVGYRYYDTREMQVAFPFGYGLSYTTFAYSNLRLDRQEITDQETLTVSVDITNTGNVAGKEIVQLYIRDNTRACRRPDKELKGYEKVALEPGETKTVTMTLDYRSFAWYNTDLKDWYAASGKYDVMVGTSSRQICLSASVQINSSIRLPLKLDLNTTLAELSADDRTVKYGEYLKNKSYAFFDQYEGDETLSGDAKYALVDSMPMRTLVSFGICTKEEVLDVLKKLMEL